MYLPEESNTKKLEWRARTEIGTTDAKYLFSNKVALA